MSQRKIKRNDFFLTGVLLVVPLCLLFYQNTIGAKAGAVVVILQDGEEIGRYPLREETELLIEGNHGENLLIIQDGKAFMKEADCPDGLCVKQKAISRQGESLICLPHRLVVTVEGASENDVDAVADSRGRGSREETS